MSSTKKRGVDKRPLPLRVRKSLGLVSQDKFARLMGVSKTTVQNWEGRRGRPSPDNLKAMTALEGLPAALLPELRSAIEQFEYHARPEVMPPEEENAILRYVKPEYLREMEKEARERHISLEQCCASVIDYGWRQWLKELQSSANPVSPFEVLPRARRK